MPNRSVRSFTSLVRKLMIIIFALQAPTAFSSYIVKKSHSDICHPPQSNWYKRTKNYTAFESLASCLNSGGKLPKGLSLVSLAKAQKSDTQREYSRSAFGYGWADNDGDCQNSRAEALIKTSTTQVRFNTDKQCRVTAGRWISPFSNQVIQNASNIDIDHVVPLAWSWGRGAEQWTRDKRERFANDPVNLLPVEASLNLLTITI